MLKIKTVINIFKEKEERSQWNKGINEYAIDILERYEDLNNTSVMPSLKNLQEKLLNGAPDWKQYSYGACALINRYDIAERLLTQNQRKKLPNTWKELDEQTKALKITYRKIKKVYLAIQYTHKILMEKKNV